MTLTFISAGYTAIHLFSADIVFLVFCYQYYIYKVDPKRVNEFGTSGESDDQAGSLQADQSDGQAALPQTDQSAVDSKNEASKKDD